MFRPSYLFAVAGLTLLPACPLLDLQAEVAETCVTYPGIHVDAAPAATVSLEQSFTLDHLDSLQGLADQGFSIGFVRAQVRATSGISDLGFVARANIAIASGDPSSTLPTLEVFDCEACGAGGPTLDLDAATIADAAPYVATGSLVVTVDFTGQLPTTAWTMDVDVCTSGSASYTIDP
jgi:hypothetical protein